MSVLKDVLSELFSMFVADARLTMAILAVVAVVAFLIHGAGVSTTAAGVVLLLACLAVLVEAVLREARNRR